MKGIISGKWEEYFGKQLRLPSSYDKLNKIWKNYPYYKRIDTGDYDYARYY